MVGRQALPFGEGLIFGGELLVVSFRVMKIGVCFFINPDSKKKAILGHDVFSY